MTQDIRIFLEEEHRLHFYDLLGGLADNLLSLNRAFAGTFVSCETCGNTITLKEKSWACGCCGEQFSLHFSTLTDNKKGVKEAKVKVRGINKAKLHPHWYFADENWSTAEFISLITRLPAETFLPSWLRSLKVDLSKDSEICNILCWPRMKFGSKTIQPDFIIEFNNHIVILEFKRPDGGLVPPREIAGQLIFLNHVGSVLGKKRSLVIVPGPDSMVRSSDNYATDAIGAIDDAKNNWALSDSIVEITRNEAFETTKKVFLAIGWESLLQATIAEITTNVEKSWTSTQVVEKLEYFKTSRTSLGLFPI